MDDVDPKHEQIKSETEKDSPKPDKQEQTVKASLQRPLEQTAKPKKRKWILQVLVVVVVLLLGAVGYVVYQTYVLKKDNRVIPLEHYPIEAKPTVESQKSLTPTTTKTPTETPEKKLLKHWDKYISNRFGFEFENPGNFFLQTTYEEFYPDQGHINIYPMEYWELITDPNTPGRGGPPVIGISAYENKKGLTIIDWAKEDTAHSNYAGNHIDALVDNQAAIKYAWEGMGKGETVLVLKPGNDYIVAIGMFVSDETAEGFEAILKSFAFLE